MYDPIGPYRQTGQYKTSESHASLNLSVYLFVCLSLNFALIEMLTHLKKEKNFILNVYPAQAYTTLFLLVLLIGVVGVV